MALSLRTPSVVCKEVIGTTFSFYSPDQVRPPPPGTRRRHRLRRPVRLPHMRALPGCAACGRSCRRARDSP